MFKIRKKFRFEASHRLYQSYSKKCQQLHGHSYVVEVFLQSEKLNEDGMVIDFGFLKDRFKDLIDRFDHSQIISIKDPLLDQLSGIEIENQKDFGIIVFNENPTAEFFAKYFYEQFKTALNNTENNVEIASVRIHETETGWAEYSEE